MSLKRDEVARMRREGRRFGKDLIGGDSCYTGKRMYSKAQAKRALKHARARRQTQREASQAEQAIYLCRLCRHWHLTKQIPRNKAGALGRVA